MTDGDRLPSRRVGPSDRQERDMSNSPIPNDDLATLTARLDALTRENEHLKGVMPSESTEMHLYGNVGRDRQTSMPGASAATGVTHPAENTSDVRLAALTAAVEAYNAAATKFIDKLDNLEHVPTIETYEELKAARGLATLAARKEEKL